MHHFNYRGAVITSRFDPEFVRMNNGFPFSANIDGTVIHARTLRGIKCMVTKTIRAGFPEEDCLQEIIDRLSDFAQGARGDRKTELRAIAYIILTMQF